MLFAKRFQVISGTEAATSFAHSRVAEEVGVRGAKSNAIIGDSETKEERTTYSLDGKKEHGFASSEVPTMEEKEIYDGRARDFVGSQAPPDSTKAGANSASKEPAPMRTKDGELYGAPADAVANDLQPPHTHGGKGGAHEKESLAARARDLLRKHLSLKLGSKNWNVPTPAPKIDPHGFDDPVSDEFFEDVWMAAAVHNTEIYRMVFHAVPDDLS